MECSRCLNYRSGSCLLHPNRSQDGERKWDTVRSGQKKIPSQDLPFLGAHPVQGDPHRGFIPAFLVTEEPLGLTVLAPPMRSPSRSGNKTQRPTLVLCSCGTRERTLEGPPPQGSVRPGARMPGCAVGGRSPELSAGWFSVLFTGDYSCLLWPV